MEEPIEKKEPETKEPKEPEKHDVNKLIAQNSVLTEQVTKLIEQVNELNSKNIELNKINIELTSKFNSAEPNVPKSHDVVMDVINDFSKGVIKNNG